MTWSIWRFIPDNGSPEQIHCVPDDDLRGHDVHNCACHPDTDDEGVVVHNSFDGREEFETGARLAS